ncbi:MAG TPA: RNA methyltransferase [Azoarcus taiwanensis]|nr:RNA methyltransferase [Azoarcus taiwanensis]
MKAVSSRDNPRFKRLRGLSQSAKDRRQQGLTVLDGPHLLCSALDAGVRLAEVWVSESGLVRPEIESLLQRCPDTVETFSLPDALFSQASPVDSPSGVLAVFAPVQPLRTLNNGNWLILDRVQDPGNLGTLLRTAAAAGIAHALLTPGCAQAWSPRVLRAGMGAHFIVPIHEQVDAMAALNAFGGEVIATGLMPSASSLYEIDLAHDVAWLFGAEGEGLSAPLFDRADRIVTIPMTPGCESLNVGAAAAICLFEQYRQQRAGGSR